MGFGHSIGGLKLPKTTEYMWSSFVISFFGLAEGYVLFNNKIGKKACHSVDFISNNNIT